MRRQSMPGGTGAHDPKDGIEDGAVVLPGATGPFEVIREEGLDQAPLVVGEVHRFSRLSSVVSRELFFESRESLVESG